MKLKNKKFILLFIVLVLVVVVLAVIFISLVLIKNSFSGEVKNLFLIEIINKGIYFDNVYYSFLDEVINSVLFKN